MKISFLQVSVLSRSKSSCLTLDRFGDVTMKAKDMMIPLAEAAIDPGSKFAAGDLPTAVHSQTLGFMSFPVAEFLENLARQVLQLQVNLNSSSRDDPPVQQLAVSQTCSSCFKSSEDKGIIDSRKGTHSPRIAVNQACLIIDDIPDNSFIDSVSLKSPCTPRAFSPAAGRTHGRSATGTTGILDGILTIGQYAGVLLGGMDLRSLPEAPGGESSGDAHPVKRMDEDAAEVLPPAGGEAESVSIDTVGGVCVCIQRTVRNCAA